MNSTYSFSDVSLVLNHPSVGQFVITGQGVGSVTVARANDMTQHDIAADGSIMASKIVTKNGTIAIAIQQTSAAHKFLKKWLAYVSAAPTSEWTRMNAILKNPSVGEAINITGISPQKRADSTYQQTGQQETWNLMAMEITDQ